jgi:hypothetical protein
MSVMKYVDEQGPSHGGPLLWPGYHGIPVRSSGMPALTEDEIDRQMEFHHDFHSREFDLSDPVQKAEYDDIMDRIVNGWYTLYYREPPVREPQTGKRLVYMEWFQRYGALNPNTKFNAVTSSIAKVG